MRRFQDESPPNRLGTKGGRVAVLCARLACGLLLRWLQAMGTPSPYVHPVVLWPSGQGDDVPRVRQFSWWSWFMVSAETCCVSRANSLLFVRAGLEVEGD
jgi:hypothetical protein